MSSLNLGERLLTLCRDARDELVLCAPFAKAHVVGRILGATPTTVRIRVITRWRAEEVAAGVSDVSILEMLGDRGDVVLHDQLHAKYYRSEGAALIGSANLTGKALGWATLPNLELLVDAYPHQVQELESRLTRDGVVATPEMAIAVADTAALLARPVLYAEGVEQPARQVWPNGSPPFVIRQISTGHTLVAPCRLRPLYAAQGDLSVLDPPVGLSQPAFNALIASRLQQHPAVIDLESQLIGRARFGAVRDHISARFDMDTRDASAAWQTLMRWLLTFLPDRYHVETPHHSEVFRLTQPKGLP